MPFKAGHKTNRLKIKGKKFGRLLVLKYICTKKHNTIWRCKCDCGKILDIAGSSMTEGNTKSCGCLRIENRRKAIFKHGMRDHPFYKAWCSMRYRCSNKKQKGYKNWGGRGIKVCKSWSVFLNFKEDMYSEYLLHIKKHGKKQTTLERINNSKNYSPNNCKWATRFEQNSNTRRTVMIEFNGKKMTMSQWARELNIDRSTLYKRIFIAKWPLEKALTKKC